MANIKFDSIWQLKTKTINQPILIFNKLSTITLFTRDVLNRLLIGLQSKTVYLPLCEHCNCLDTFSKRLKISLFKPPWIWLVTGY